MAAGFYVGLQTVRRSANANRFDGSEMSQHPWPSSQEPLASLKRKSKLSAKSIAALTIANLIGSPHCVSDSDRLGIHQRFRVRHVSSVRIQAFARSGKTHRRHQAADRTMAMGSAYPGLVVGVHSMSVAARSMVNLPRNAGSKGTFALNYRNPLPTWGRARHGCTWKRRLLHAIGGKRSSPS